MNVLVTEILTSEPTLRVRIKRLPAPGEFDEFDMRRFQVGDVYDVNGRFGLLLVVAGYAEVAPVVHRAGTGS